jgi:hypothetical protein
MKLVPAWKDPGGFPSALVVGGAWVRAVDLASVQAVDLAWGRVADLASARADRGPARFCQHDVRTSERTLEML